MFCTKCGYNNPVTIKICKNCEVDLQPGQKSTVRAADPEKLVYAGFHTRFLSALLDFLLIAAILILTLFAIGILVIITGNDDILHNAQAITFFYWLAAGCAAAYFIMMESGTNGATLGERWLNIKVMRKDSMPQSATRSCMRFFARFLYIVFFPVSLPLQIFSKQKQGLHDLLAGTVVVRANDNKKISVMATLLVLFMTLMLPLLAFTATAGMPYIQHYIQDVQLNKGIQTGRKAALAVARFYRNNGRVPAAIEDTREDFIRSRHVSKIDINQQNGEITLTFSETAHRDIQGKHLLFKPALAADQSISWQCSSTDIETRFLPDSCL